MHFSLHFFEPTCQQTNLDQQSHFPFSVEKNYENSGMKIQHFHYSLHTIQLDHYVTSNVKNYRLLVNVENACYFLLALKGGHIAYSSLNKPKKVIPVRNNSCMLLYAGPGDYQVELKNEANDYVVICIAPDLLYPLSQDFPQLTAFMRTSEQDVFSSLESCTMDHKFLYRLQRITQVPPMRAKDFNRHLLYELPDLLSAYKGLLTGKDRHSYDKKLFDNIVLYIQQALDEGRPVSPTTICNQFPLSRKKLERLFIANLSTSPGKYISAAKKLVIAKLLANSSMNLLAIAHMYGYSDVSALNKAYKKQFGITANQYRKLAKTS
ncbi:hypothetical protein C4F49_16665 [Sphingobacterium sp. KB22]|uniref:HTH araC/xylS-type domain-containing protein n=1 Tax=Sphingobacterium hungaricum TaxID=2082723 RepID=A0A928V059_9SPHI|nr:hypothetical protein [Sphingobacterium hungaricum]